MASNKKKTALVSRGRLTVRYYDYNLLASVILLTCFGLVMLYSTSAYTASKDYGSDTFFFGKQAAISAACLICVLIFSQLDYHFYAKFAMPLYVVANILLIATKFMGQEVKGAARWIKIGPVQFQTAEIAKLAIILFLPVLIVKFGKNMKGLKAPGLLLVLGGISAILTKEFTENLSTAIILAGITVTLIFVAHPQGKKMVLPGAALLIVIVIAARYLAVRVADGSSSFRWRRKIGRAHV